MNPKKKENFLKALSSLEEALSLPIIHQRDRAGIIQNFEFVYELSWKLLKSLLEEEGQSSSTPKDVFSKAYQAKLINDEKIWIQIIQDRNLSVHTYNQDLAIEITERIKEKYFTEFKKLKDQIS